MDSEFEFLGVWKINMALYALQLVSDCSLKLPLVDCEEVGVATREDDGRCTGVELVPG